MMREFYAGSGLALDAARARGAFATLVGSPRLGRVWLAEQEGAPAGYVVLTVCYGMQYGALRGFVDDLYVRPAARRRGVGGALVAAVRRACAERGLRALLVEVGAGNDAALRLYRRYGFVGTAHLLMINPNCEVEHEG